MTPNFKPRKFVIDKRVYNDENNSNFLRTSTSVRSKNLILGEYETTPVKGIKKRNPNFSYNENDASLLQSKQAAQHRPVKSSIHLYDSKDNPLRIKN
jgi:hypothetical protein